jgi:hypothetical protein
MYVDFFTKTFCTGVRFPAVPPLRLFAKKPYKNRAFLMWGSRLKNA